MSETFDVAELVQLAVEDEKTGVAFYGVLAERTVNPALRTLFQELQKQERGHQKRFEDMLDALGGVTVHEQYSGEYALYLHALTEGRAFPNETTGRRLAAQCHGDRDAVNLASQFERDTLILMNEMRSLVPLKDRAIVEELTREEQSHLVALAEARKQLGD